MDGWIELWSWVYKIGLCLFALLALAIIPLGARDLWRMFRELGDRHGGK